LIGYRLAAGESEIAWTAFLQDFFQRGFAGRRLRLITTDGSTGLQAALALVFPHVPPQRCGAHKLRNIADKVPKKEVACVREAAAIYQAESRRAALRVYHAWAEKWRAPRPRALASLEHDLHERLNFFAVPRAHWRKVRTTNIIERCFREVRRRTRPMSSFTNPASCDRILFGVLSPLNRSWEKTPWKQFTQLC
jgi:transposase-like protein